MEYIRIEERDFCFLGRGSKIIGQLEFQGPTRLYAHIEGDIKMLDNADLSIERSAKIRGTIACHQCEVFGSVEGVIKSTGVVTLHPSATMIGEINAQQLVISPGAKILGDLHTLN
jgi:cytoskeletal protein CcmA (bactofilin family)